MEYLLSDPLGENSPLQIRKDTPDETLDRIPFLRLTEEFLKIMRRDGSIRLTPLGALPKKTLCELYDLGFIKEEPIESGVVKLRREIDSVVLTSLHVTTKLAGLARKNAGRLSLTPEGTRLLHPDNRKELLRLILNTFTGKFNWSYKMTAIRANLPDSLAGDSRCISFVRPAERNKRYGSTPTDI